MKSVLVAIAVSLSLAAALPAAARAQAPAPGDSLRLKVDGMVCSLCAFGVEQRLKKLDRVERVTVDLDSGLVVLLLERGAAVPDSTLRREVRKAGFALRGVTRLERAQ